MNKAKTNTKTSSDRAKSKDKGTKDADSKKRGRSPSKGKKASKPRKRTGYNIFMKENYEKIRNEGFETKEILKEVGARWAKMSDGQKKTYNDKAEKESGSSSKGKDSAKKSASKRS